MATQAKKKPIAVPKEKTWYIVNNEKELYSSTDYYPHPTIEEAFKQEEYLDKSKPIYAFEIKYLGQIETAITIKK